MKITFKIWILIIAVTLSLISIFSIPPMMFEKGVAITSVEQNSTIFQDGLREGMTILSINGQAIESIEDYATALAPLNNLGEDETQKLTITTDKIEIINLFTSQIIEDISVEEIPSTRIKTGLDLRGGARAFIKADVPLNDVQLDDLIAVSEQRLNVYGLSDVKFFKVTQSNGENLMGVEIAGSSPEDLEELIAKQGKFEAKIGNETVFIVVYKDNKPIPASHRAYGAEFSNSVFETVVKTFNLIGEKVKPGVKRRVWSLAVLG